MPSVSREVHVKEDFPLPDYKQLAKQHKRERRQQATKEYIPRRITYASRRIANALHQLSALVQSNKQRGGEGKQR